MTQIISININPTKYFKEYDFAESLVSRIVYQAELGQLEIILDYMGFVRTIAHPLDDPAFQDPTDFRRLLFGNVTQLERTNYRFKVGFQGFDPTNFNLSPSHVGTVTVEAACVGRIIDARRTIARYRAEIQMGSFGTYGFEFGSLLASQRLVKTMSLPGREFSHFDYYTSERIDYWNPFPDG